MKKILIAEDDTILSMRLVRALEKHGDTLDIIEVSNGKIAMDVLKKHQISLLVTDINMPEVDGFALLAHVREHYPVIPCFVMTAIEAPEVRSRLPQDLVRFFAKPFDVDVFTATVMATVTRQIPRGVLRGISVSSFCTMIEMEKKTCLFEIAPPGKEPGRLYFDSGILFDATYGDLSGEPAAIALLGHEKATFRFRHFPDKKIPRRIKQSFWALMEKAEQDNTAFDDIDWDKVVDVDKEKGA
jgi:CheY-like chemotaxis protein